VKLRAFLIAITAAVASLGPAGTAAAAPRARGDVQVLTLIPAPGYPALPHLMGGHIFEGTYDNPTGSSLPSRVLEYTDAGELVNSWTVGGQDVSKPHGVQVAANDARGRLLLLDKTSGRIIRLDPRTGAQTLYASVPDLPTCSNAPSGTPCSPAILDLTPMPDYAAWGPDGSLYVTDYQQAVIWRIPPGGGTAQVWLADRRLDGGPFGTACILLMPDHRTLLFDQASNGGLGGTNPTTGKLFEVPIEPGDHPGAIKQLWESGPADAPDGCVLARSGHIYVALVGNSNQIVELDAAGRELVRFGQQYTGTNNSSVPFDSPSGLAYLGTDLIVANQSYFADNAANQALLNVETLEPGVASYVPANAGLKAAPKAKHKKHKHKPPKRKRKHRRSSGAQHPAAPGDTR
jgi:sugar lactone lactonase YvrE